MKTKTTRSRTTKQRKIDNQQPLPSTVGADHLNVALLALIDDGHFGRVDPSITIARSILATTAADDMMHADKVGIFASITAAIQADYEKRSEHAVLFRQIQSYGAEDISVTNSAVAFDIYVNTVTTSVMTGAALMYELLKGGAR